MKTIVVYKSKYGSSMQYADWIGEALGCQAEDIASVKLHDLLSYDVIIYVGGIYASSINGFKQFEKYLDSLKDKKLVLCMVGVSNPSEQERYNKYFTDNVPQLYRESIKPFALRGDQLFSKMSFLHRTMMKMPKSMAEKKPVEERTEDDIHFIESYGKDVRFASKESINSIVEYVKSIAG